MAEKGYSWFRKWWRHTTLVQRLVLVALLPSAVSTLFLAIVLTRQHIATLQTMTRDTAAAYVDQAAAVAADPLRERDQARLHRIAGTIAHLPHVRRVRILASDGTLLAEAGAKSSPNRHIQLRRNISERDGSHASIGSLLVEIDDEEASAVRRTAILNTILWLSVAILLAIVLSWQQARWISAPLRRLSEAMRGLGKFDRRLAIEVEVTDESEIGELQRGFNTAASTLHALHQHMERRISEATEELAQKNIALEQASKAKARFLAGATHDLRQPLFALTLFSSSLAEKETNPERLDRIAHVQECIESLDRLFSELLDLSQLETGVMQPEIRDFALDEVFREVSRNFRMQAEQKSLRLVTRATDAMVRSDRTMLARILNNLVSNALRCTTQGGILVAARKRGQCIRIDVHDTGIGIASEHHAHIFDEFYRIEHARELDQPPGRREPRGLGLGLATVQRLAELLGTVVTLRSQPGKGTLFTLTIPASTASATRQVTAQPINHTNPSRQLKNVPVLVIDDDRAILVGIGELLRGWGCQVRTAVSGTDALRVVGDWPLTPKIVISDLHLGGGCNGTQAMQALAGHYGTPPESPPFARLLVTGETDPARLRPALQSGVPILFKPVAVGPLREALIALLRTRNGPTTLGKAQRENT